MGLFLTFSLWDSSSLSLCGSSTSVLLPLRFSTLVDYYVLRVVPVSLTSVDTGAQILSSPWLGVDVTLR